MMMMFVCSSQGNGPLAEIEFWRERNATLSALHEQTKLPIVRKVLDVMKESDSLLVANLQPVLTELFKFHMEASDNVRFLSTVERHFKVGWVHCSLESQPHGFNFCLFIQHLKNCSKIYITFIIETTCKSKFGNIQYIPSAGYPSSPPICKTFSLSST